MAGRTMKLVRDDNAMFLGGRQANDSDMQTRAPLTKSHYYYES